MCRCVLLLVCQCVCSLSPPSSGMLWEGVRTEDELCKLCKNITNSKIQITYIHTYKNKVPYASLNYERINSGTDCIQLMTTHTVVIHIDEHSSSKSQRT